jgi:hypothetical protein
MGLLGLRPGVVSSCFCAVGWWQQQLLCLKGGTWSPPFSTGRRCSQHGAPIMQHHPLGKASRKLHKSARDRLNIAIGAILEWPNQEGKPN